MEFLLAATFHVHTPGG